MSKAFTREDDESGTALPSRSSALVPTERFHLTREGARRLKEHPEAQVRAALDLADVLDPAAPAEKALLGVIVHARTAGGETRTIRLVSHEEQLLLGDGCSPRSPLGRALLGAEVGDVREFVTPRGREELEILELATDVQRPKPRAVKAVKAVRTVATAAKTKKKAAPAKTPPKKLGKSSARRVRAAS
jgi:hypothetical protein